MSKIYTEATFEAAIEHSLVADGGYKQGDPNNFDRERCLDPTVLIPFIKETQPAEWEYLTNLWKEHTEKTLLDDLSRALNSEHEGCLMVLRHGFECFGKLFRVAYFAPASSMNPETKRLYEANRLTVTRQLQYSEKHNKTLDLVLSLNGIPVATAELKNPMTGQTWRNAVHQYKNDRDQNDLIFRFGKRALARFMSLQPHNISQKTEVMVEHFRTFTSHKIGGRAKAMVVTSSRLHAVRYKKEFDKYIAEKGYTGIKTLVAFSGTVIDPDIPGKEYTEVGMNDGIREKELPERFASDEYQVLLVAEKYQTGFDQPLLHTMYVDKRLSGVQAVQTLSRLNRTHPGKEDTFVLDFVNEPDEILAAFQQYYEQATIGERAEPRQLYELQAKLDAEQVYYKAEVEEFCRVFYKPRINPTPADHAKMNACIDPAVNRWLGLDEDVQEEFRKVLVAYRNLYAFLSQVIPLQDSDLEKLYSYIRFLLTKLPRGGSSEAYNLDDEVALKYYRLQKLSEGVIDLRAGVDPTQISGPTSVGTGVSHEEMIELSQLIDILNERFGTEFKPADQLFLDSIREDAAADTTLRQAAMANTIENFGYVFLKALEGLFIDRIDQNEEITAKFMNEREFQELVGKNLLKQVYEQIRAEEAFA